MSTDAERRDMSGSPLPSDLSGIDLGFDVRELGDKLRKTSLTFVVPAYNEADGILPALESLWTSVSTLGLAATIFVSDSSDTPQSSSEHTAMEWAHRTGALLVVDHSDTRRSLKEALNNAFERVDSDLLVQVNADVIVPVRSLAVMLHRLTQAPPPIAAVGTVLPDPLHSSGARRAGAWQMRAVWRAASLSEGEVTRAEGAFWGCWREFYKSYRYPLGSGSIHDDMELAKALARLDQRSVNVPDAHVYKVPPGSLADFCSARVRWAAAAPGYSRRWTEYIAAAIEARHDPVGAVLFLRAVLWCWAHRGQFEQLSASETWMPLQSTKRQSGPNQ